MANKGKVQVPLRPLSNGIIRNVSPTMIPAGGLFNTEGAIMKETGIGRRTGFELIYTHTADGFRWLADYELISGGHAIAFIDTDGRFGLYDILQGSTTFYDLTETLSLNIKIIIDALGDGTAEIVGVEETSPLTITVTLDALGDGTATISSGSFEDEGIVVGSILTSDDTAGNEVIVTEVTDTQTLVVEATSGSNVSYTETPSSWTHTFPVVGSFYDTNILVGDILESSLTAGNEVIVTGITSNTVLTVEAVSGGNVSWNETLDDWEHIAGELAGDFPDEQVDSVQYLNYLIMTDNVRQPFYFDGSSLTYVSSGGRYRVKTLTIAWDRLYYGNISYIDSAPGGVENNPYMIVWSEVGAINTIDPEDHYLHVPYVQGYLQKLAVTGNLVIALFDYGVMIGRPTQYEGSTLPIAFAKFETGKRGVKSVTATAEAVDGIHYISIDNVFVLRNDLTFDPIGDAISEAFLKIERPLEYSKILAAPRQNLLYICLASRGAPGTYTNYITINTITGKWARFTESFNHILVSDVVTGIKYGDIAVTATYADLDTSLTYGDVSIVYYNGYIITAKDNKLYLASMYAQQDEDSPIEFNIESGDIDLDYPDNQKTFTRCSVRLYQSHDTDLTFSLMASNDQGTNWYTIGTIIIPAGHVEGYTNFLFTGPAARFKLQTSSLVTDFILTEIVIDAHIKGVQYDNMQ